MITAIYYDLQNTLLKKYTIKETKITHDSKIILQLNMIWTRLRLHWLRWYKPCLSFALIVVCNAKPCMPILHYFHVTDKIINQITFNMCQQKHFFFFFFTGNFSINKFPRIISAFCFSTWRTWFVNQEVLP